MQTPAELSRALVLTYCRRCREYALQTAQRHVVSAQIARLSHAILGQFKDMHEPKTCFVVLLLLWVLLLQVSLLWPPNQLARAPHRQSVAMQRATHMAAAATATRSAVPASWRNLVPCNWITRSPPASLEACHPTLAAAPPYATSAAVSASWRQQCPADTQRVLWTPTSSSQPLAHPQHPR
jgi:hypothetical protein